jgi:hypothetical protein
MIGLLALAVVVGATSFPAVCVVPTSASELADALNRTFEDEETSEAHGGVVSSAGLGEAVAGYVRALVVVLVFVMFVSH